MFAIRPVAIGNIYTPATTQRRVAGAVFGRGVYTVPRTTMRKPIQLPPDPRNPKKAIATQEVRRHAPCPVCGSMKNVRNNGRQPLVTFYSGLMDRVKTMQSKSVNLSVVA